MAAWLAIAKVVAPHITTIVSAALPVFTKRKGDPEANQIALAQQQIAELQEAATRNGAHIRELAEQLRATVDALEKGAAIAETKMRQVRLVVAVAAVLSVVALVVAAMALMAS